jgi:galactokinase
MPANDQLLLEYQSHFGEQAQYLVRSPGRVNLIGEHTDYNDGWVLPVAINYDVRAVVKTRPDRTMRVYSYDFKQEDSFSLDALEHAAADKSWSNYVRGVASVLQQEGYHLHGMDMLIAGDVPLGAGLSSSAALELATITAFRAASALEISAVKAATCGQRAENEFVGMRCGIMDQFISSLGQANHALLIDCRSLEYQLVPIPAGVNIVVVNSMVHHSLVDSAYNERRAQCEAGAKALGVRALRDVSVETFKQREAELSALVARRCRHVVTEDQRVLDSVKALEWGDLAAFGQLMNASHESMHYDYEITVPELDILAEIQQQVKGCYGARMTGGGFGGCTVALVEQNAVQPLVDTVKSEYPRRTGKTPEIYICQATAGANILYPA